MKIISAHKYYSDRDGASRYELEVNRLLEEAGNEVAPFAMRLPENLPSPWSKYFVSPVQTKQPSFSFDAIRTVVRMLYSWEARDAMRRLIGAFHPSVAHIHNIYTQLSPSVLDALHEAHVPTVMTVHDYHLVAPNYMLWHNHRVENLRSKGIVRATFSRFHKQSYLASFAQATAFHLHRFLRLYDRNIASFLCPSTFVAEEMKRAGFPADHIKVLPHFFDTKGVTASFSGDGSVLFVGRFVEEKGVLFVLELAKAMPDTSFVLAGDGPLGEVVRKKAEALQNVQVFGWTSREDLAKVYQKVSLVLVPSLWPEVFGLVALEAMAYGKPVLASRMGGLPEVVTEEVGRVLPAGDVQAWVKAIEEVVFDEALCKQLGKAGRERVEKVYTPQKHLQALLECYQNVGVRS